MDDQPGQSPRRRRRRRRGSDAQGAAEAGPRPDASAGPRPDAPAGPRPQAGRARPPSRGREGQRRPRPERPPPPPPPPPPAPDDPLASPALDASQRADVPLTPEEASEVRQHLRFLFKNRQVLRLKVNAAEDLLLNGSRPPTHRGTCLHLLSKVDLAAASSALTRVAAPTERVELLGGIVRFSQDVGILLLYLEALAASASPSQAAAVFDKAVRRMDFAKLSPPRVRRLLDLVASAFEGHDRIRVLFDLLRSEDFRHAFDASAERLPEELAESFVPLRAVHETVFEGRPDRFGADVVAQGVQALLSAPDEVLRGHPEPVRERLLESAVRLVRDPEIADRAEDVLLDSLPRASRAFSRIGLLRAAELLRRHEDAHAERLLQDIHSAHPDFRLPGRWLEALRAPRLARLGLIGPPRGRWRRAFWLDAQRPAWIRTVEGEAAVGALDAARLQRDLPLAGIAPVLLSGVSEDGVVHVAVPAVGRPAAAALDKRLGRPEAFALALQAAQVLFSLALAGVVLPDASLERFLVTEGEPPLLWLGDLTGSRSASPAEASRTHLALAAAFRDAVVGRVPPSEVAPATLERLAAARDLPEAIGLLAGEA